MQQPGLTPAPAPYQYAPEQRRPVREPRRVWPWITALLALIVLVAAVLLYKFVTTASSTGVPDVTGQRLAAAERALIRAGYTIGPVHRQASSQFAAGDVIRTVPAAGSTPAKATRITIYVSSGQGLVRVPPVVGQQVAAATATLQNAGFKVKTVPQPNSSAAPNTVLAESPPANTKVKPGSTIVLTVSGATTVPFVIGETQAQAVQKLQQQQLNASPVFQPDPSGTAAPGTVWKTTPQAGKNVAPGQTVTLYIQPSQSASPSPSGSTSPSPSGSPSSSPAGGPAKHRHRHR
jgi:serine/threonine-protein kinase